MNGGLKILVTAIVTALAVVLVVYLTPLKHLNLVEPTIKDIDPSAYWKEYVANPDAYMLIDVRQPALYNATHAKGSINMPIETLLDKHKTLPRRGKTIVLICTGGAESGVAYGFLEHQGFLNLLRIHEGLRNWIIQGLPIEGTNISTTTAQVVSVNSGSETCPKNS